MCTYKLRIPMHAYTDTQMPTFNSNIITFCKQLSYGILIFNFSPIDSPFFHHFGTQFHVNDVITASMACKKFAHVIYQLSSTMIYYYQPVSKLCSITLVRLNGSFRYCRIPRILSQLSDVVLAILSVSILTIQVFYFKIPHK